MWAFEKYGTDAFGAEDMSCRCTECELPKRSTEGDRTNLDHKRHFLQRNYLQTILQSFPTNGDLPSLNPTSCHTVWTMLKRRIGGYRAFAVRHRSVEA